MRSLNVGDEVLVQNPETKRIGREKITRIHDHGKDRHASASFVNTTELSMQSFDGSSQVEINHILASSHYIMTRRPGKEKFEMKRADEAEIGDSALICNTSMDESDETQQEAIVIGKVCYEAPVD